MFYSIIYLKEIFFGIFLILHILQLSCCNWLFIREVESIKLLEALETRLRFRETFVGQTTVPPGLLGSFCLVLLCRNQDWQQQQTSLPSLVICYTCRYGGINLCQVLKQTICTRRWNSSSEALSRLHPPCNPPITFLQTHRASFWKRRGSPWRMQSYRRSLHHHNPFLSQPRARGNIGVQSRVLGWGLSRTWK